MLVSFIGIIVGVALFIYLSFKGNNLALSAGIGAIVILLFTGPANIISGVSEFWVTGVSNALKSYFLIFMLGGIFGKIMDISGGARTIAFQLLKVIRRNEKNPYFFAVYFIVLMYFICTYVGIHGFIVVFTVLPIGRELYHELDIPWRFYCYGSGGCIPAYYLLGSVSSVPSVAASLNGVHVGVHAGLSVVMAVVFFIVHMLVVNWDVNHSIKKGEKFFPGGNEIWKIQMATFKDDGTLPKLYQAVIPMVVMIVCAARGIPTWVALTIGCILGVIFLQDKLKGQIKTALNTGATSVFVALVNVCGAAGLGTVIKNVPGYAFINDRLSNLSPLAAGVFLCIFGTVLLGSSSSSMPAFGEQEVGFMNAAGLTQATSFKLMSCACNWVYPPHNTGVVNASSTGKIAYKDAVVIYMKSTAPANTVVLILLIALIQFGVI